jgi:hypothetical protein
VPAIHFALGIFMTAIVYGLVRSTTREPDLAVIVAFSLTGILLTLVSARLGLDVSSAMLS